MNQYKRIHSEDDIKKQKKRIEIVCKEIEQKGFEYLKSKLPDTRDPDQVYYGVQSHNAGISVAACDVGELIDAPRYHKPCYVSALFTWRVGGIPVFYSVAVPLYHIWEDGSPDLVGGIIDRLKKQFERTETFIPTIIKIGRVGNISNQPIDFQRWASRYLGRDKEKHPIELIKIYQ
jgi:hypothetical protein